MTRSWSIGQRAVLGQKCARARGARVTSRPYLNRCRASISGLRSLGAVERAGAGAIEMRRPAKTAAAAMIGPGAGESTRRSAGRAASGPARSRPTAGAQGDARRCARAQAGQRGGKTKIQRPRRRAPHQDECVGHAAPGPAATVPGLPRTCYASRACAADCVASGPGGGAAGCRDCCRTVGGLGRAPTGWHAAAARGAGRPPGRARQRSSAFSTPSRAAASGTIRDLMAAEMSNQLLAALGQPADAERRRRQASARARRVARPTTGGRTSETALTACRARSTISPAVRDGRRSMLKRFMIGFVLGVGAMYWYIHHC